MPILANPVTETSVAWDALVSQLLTSSDLYAPLRTATGWAQTEDARQHALIAGALQAVVRAMSSEPGVLALACQALVAIVQNGSTRKQAAVDSGALRASVGALRAHPGEWTVAEEVLTALGALFCSSDGRREREGVDAGVPRAGSIRAKVEFVKGAL
jgi:hypothetical protein